MVLVLHMKQKGKEFKLSCCFIYILYIYIYILVSTWNVALPSPLLCGLSVFILSFVCYIYIGRPITILSAAILIWLTRTLQKYESTDFLPLVNFIFSFIGELNLIHV